mgnify:CR=1 FL=1
MKNNWKKILSVFLVVAAIVSLLSVAALAEDGDMTLTISMEGATLGQGFYVEPKQYTLSEINSLLAGEGYGPYTGETLTAGMATLAMLLDQGLEYTNTGAWEDTVYLSGVKGIDKGELHIPSIISENGGPTDEENDGNEDEYLGEFDYSQMSGWMITVDHHMIGVGCGNYNAAEAEAEGHTFGDGSVIRWQFTLYGYGLDLGVDNGWGMGDPYYTAADKGTLYRKYAQLNGDGFFAAHAQAKADALAVMEDLTATQEQVDGALAALEAAAEKPERALDAATVLNETMAQLASTVSAPSFGTTAGEWSVLALARGGFYDKNNAYFTDYYDRIVQTVNETAASVNLNGALHKVKSTENSRLILALSAIGKDARKVGDWNLVQAYSANGFNWIKKQGINGPVFALIALDSKQYPTADTTIRSQCVEYILSKELTGGGWALSGAAADPDMTAMALQALAPYVSDATVAAACERAFGVLSSIQKDTGGYASWGSVNSESIAQVVVACTAHGIDPHTDPRFVKNGRSALDALLSFYVKEGKGFAHVLDGSNTAVNGMATDQACYALAAYKRFKANENRLYDMTDAFDPAEPLKAILAAPQKVGSTKGTKFKATVSINAWDNEAGYKLLDAVMSIPDGVTVTDVVPSARLSGGTLSYHLESTSGKLRIVYFDAAGLTSLTVSDGDYPAELFSVSLELAKDLEPASEQTLSLESLSLKLTSDSSDEAAVCAVDTSDATVRFAIVRGISLTAVCMYTGDGVDWIPEDRKAVALFVSELAAPCGLAYTPDAGVEFFFNRALTDKSGLVTYVAVVPAALPMEELVKLENFSFAEGTECGSVQFGDVNDDGVLNAQDALNTVNLWLRRATGVSDKQILCANVNSDSRINTFDALGMAESYVNGTEFAVILKTVNKMNP